MDSLPAFLGIMVVILAYSGIASIRHMTCDSARRRVADRVDIPCNGSPADAIRAVILFAHVRGYGLEDVDIANSCVVMNEGVGWVTWGHFHTAMVSRHPDGHTVIHVAAIPKIPGEFSHITARSRTRASDGIRAILSILDQGPDVLAHTPSTE